MPAGYDNPQLPRHMIPISDPQPLSFSGGSSQRGRDLAGGGHGRRQAGSTARADKPAVVIMGGRRRPIFAPRGGRVRDHSLLPALGGPAGQPGGTHQPGDALAAVPAPRVVQHDGDCERPKWAVSAAQADLSTFRNHPGRPRLWAVTWRGAPITTDVGSQASLRCRPGRRPVHRRRGDPHSAHQEAW